MKFSCSLFVLSSLCAFSCFAATDPLVGKWKTIDDKTGYSLSDVMIEKDKNNSYKAVASELHISVNTLKTYLARAMKKLRKNEKLLLVSLFLINLS